MDSPAAPDAPAAWPSDNDNQLVAVEAARPPLEQAVLF